MSEDTLQREKMLAQLAERLDSAIKRKGTTPRALSLKLGANHSYVGTLLRKKGGFPSAPRMAQLAHELDTSVEYLGGASPDPAQMQSEVEIGDVRTTASGTDAVVRGDPIPVLGTGDCAELEVCTVDGKTLRVERSSFDDDFPVRYISRPPALASRRDLYAIYFRGESMEPRYFSGEAAIVDPRFPAGAGDFVLVQLCNGEEDVVSAVMVKQLVSSSAKEVVLRQFNPPAEFTIPRGEVLRIHYILPNNSLLFG